LASVNPERRIMAPRRETIDGRFEVNMDKILGTGGFGQVFRAQDIVVVPPLEVAAKRGSPESLRQEALMLEKVGCHPAVIRLHGYVEVSASLSWLFVDLIGGGELFDRLIDSGNLSENAARPIALNIASALTHCLSKGVVHRDVKLENVMLCVEDPTALKLIDFGLACSLPLGADGTIAPTLLYDGVGSRSWKAPELFFASAGYYAPPVDAWAYGVLVFSLLSGFFPFDEARTSDWRFSRLAQDQARGVGACDSIYNMYDRSCPFSLKCRDFVDGLLAIDPARRSTIPQAYAHDWVQAPQLPFVSAALEGVVYRSSTDGDEGWDVGEEPLPVKPPDGAPRLSRQAAAIDSPAIP
jgi:serine/threonine protein kinase